MIPSRGESWLHFKDACCCAFNLFYFIAPDFLLAPSVSADIAYHMPAPVPSLPSPPPRPRLAPVYDSDVDNVVGVVMARSILNYGQAPPRRPSAGRGTGPPVTVVVAVGFTIYQNPCNPPHEGAGGGAFLEPA